jgi:hypothetical protein
LIVLTKSKDQHPANKKKKEVTMADNEYEDASTEQDAPKEQAAEIDVETGDLKSEKKKRTKPFIVVVAVSQTQLFFYKVILHLLHTFPAIDLCCFGWSDFWV